MTSISGEIDARLNQVRRRWRRLEIIKAVSVGVVEALGLLMVFMLVDYLYAFSETVRLVLMLTWVLAVVAVVSLGASLLVLVSVQNLRRRPGALHRGTQPGTPGGTALGDGVRT